jgi:hypothetical protein
MIRDLLAAPGFILGQLDRKWPNNEAIKIRQGVFFRA